MSDYLRPEYTPLFTQVQDFIADQLNTDPQLSALGIEFLPEHRLDIEYEIKNNLGKQGTVGIVNTLKGTYGGHNGSTNAWEIEAEVDVLENPPVRRAQMKKMGLSAGSTADILDWVQESLCAPSSPTYGKFCAVSQELGEDRGIIVGRSIMKTFAIADISAVVSGEHQWVCPYALLSDLEQLSGQIEADLSVKRDKIDLSVYDYGAWSVSEYGWNGYDPMTYDPPIQMEYREIVIDTIGYIWMWITTSETQPDTYFAIRADNTQAYELISIGDEFSIITTYTPVLNEEKTQITGFVGSDTPCDASRQIVSQIGDRLAKMSDLSSISPISPYIEDANGNTISADLSCVENHPDMWQLNTGLYGTKILTQVSTDRWEYTEGDNRFVIYIDGTDTWSIEYQQNTGLDWLLIASGTDQSATRTANALTVEMTGDFSDTWTATRPVSYQRKIATEEWVGGIVGDINSVLDAINGEVI